MKQTARTFTSFNVQVVYQIIVDLGLFSLGFSVSDFQSRILVGLGFF